MGKINLFWGNSHSLLFLIDIQRAFSKYLSDGCKTFHRHLFPLRSNDYHQSLSAWDVVGFPTKIPNFGLKFFFLHQPQNLFLTKGKCNISLLVVSSDNKERIFEVPSSPKKTNRDDFDTKQNIIIKLNKE